MTAIYIAAPFPMRHELRWFRDRLTEAGHTVTSTWLDIEPDEDDVSWDIRITAAHQCLREVDAADVLAVVTDQPHEGKGGRFVELGYALARGKTIWRIGPRSNIFTALADSDAVNTAHLLARLGAEQLAVGS